MVVTIPYKSDFELSTKLFEGFEVFYLFIIFAKKIKKNK
jgi:hypothetical protein